MATDAQALKVAHALHKLVSDQIADFNLGMNILKLSPWLRSTLWLEMAKRATAKAIECEKEPE